MPAVERLPWANVRNDPGVKQIVARYNVSDIENKGIEGSAMKALSIQPPRAIRVVRAIKAEWMKFLRQRDAERQVARMSKLQELIERYCPDGVQRVSVETVCKVIKTPKGIKRTAYNDGSLYPIVDQGKQVVCGYTDNDVLVLRDYPYVVFGDHTREVKWIDEPFAVGADGTKVLKAIDGLLDKYFYYCLSSSKIDGRGYGRHWAIAKAATIPVPPIEVQREIVRLLDAYTAAHDALAAKLNEEIGLVELQCNREIDRLGNSCTEAKKYYLSDISNVQLGKMLDASKNKGDYHRYLRVNNVQLGRFELEDIGEMRFTKDELSRFRVLPGDIMVCEGGQPGRCALWLGDEEVYYQKAVHRIRCYPGVINNRYCYQLLAYYFRAHTYDSTFTGTTIKHLPLRVLKSWKIPVPSLEDQERLAERIETIVAIEGSLLNALGEELLLNEKRLSEFRNQLLSFPEKTA